MERKNYYDIAKFIAILSVIMSYPDIGRHIYKLINVLLL